ncbi:hypothetical protein [Caudoviricetes sp.]|nr:hypothetical protein [Caudoviricetes sp.]UOF81026.1 hypothetical protein [Caudoviricetes sp.]UOF81380.1 hypothetical protein [Caudoviricetes sp.]
MAAYEKNIAGSNESLTDELGKQSNHPREHSMGAVKAGPARSFKENKGVEGYSRASESFNQPSRPEKPIIKKYPFPGKPGAA